MTDAAEMPADHGRRAGSGEDDPADDDHSSQRLSALDDQLAGMAPPTPGPRRRTPPLADAEFTREMVEQLDVMLLLRMVAGGGVNAKPAVFGKFRVVRQIGEGGFASVFEVVDTKLARRVALKIARPEILLDERKTRRFLREARLASRMSHPHIVAIHEVGEHERLPFIAEELCGESLEQWLDRHPGPIAPRVAAEVVRLLADAVHVAHGAGVLHRDIKPGNVLLVPAGAGPLPADDRPGAPRSARRQTVKLGDFGLSLSLFDTDEDSSRTPSTEQGTTLGTPEWMAPESVSGAPADERTDVHALGLVLDRLLTGRCLHGGTSREDVFRRILDVDPVPADRVMPGIPADLVAVCLKCLAKNPGDRYRSAAELAVDLVRFLDGRPTIARPITRLERLGRWTVRNPARTGAVAACAAAMLLGGIAWRERSMRFTMAKRQAEAERTAARERAIADAAFHLRRAFETVRSDNVTAALEALKASESADAGLADSIAGGWLLARVHGERSTLLGPDEPGPRGGPAAIHRIAVAPDGRRLAAAGADGLLRLLPIAADGSAAGEAIVVEAGGELNDVVFSADGARLATAAEDGSVKLWDPLDGRLVREVATPGEPVFAVAFDGEGRRLFWAGADRVIRIAPLASMDSPVEIRPFDPPGAEADPDSPDIESIRVLDAGRLLVAVHNTVHVVAIPSGHVLHSFGGEGMGDVFGIDVSPDGTRLLATGWFERVGKVWDLATGELLVTLPAHPAWVHRGVFSPDGRRIVTACKDGVLRVFDAESGTFLESLVGHVGRVWDGLVHPSGMILSAGADGTVRAWDSSAARGGARVFELPLSGVVHVAPVPALGALMVHPANGPAVSVDPTSGQSRPCGSATDAGVRRVVPSPAGERIAIASEREFRVDAIDGGGGLRLFAGPGPEAFAWGPGGGLLAAVDLTNGDDPSSAESRLVAWAPGFARRNDLATLAGHATSLAVSRQARLAVAAGTAITLFDPGDDGLPLPASARLLADLAPRVSPGILLAWSPDGTRLAWGSSGGLAGILDAATGEQGAVVTSFVHPVRGIVWADNGRSLAVADTECVRLYDALTGTMFDEIRPGWRIASFVVGETVPGTRGPALVVGGDATRSAGDAKPTGRLLLFDLGRRSAKSEDQ